MTSSKDLRSEVDAAVVDLTKGIERALAAFRRRVADAFDGAPLPIVSSPDEALRVPAAAKPLRLASPPRSGLSKCERAILTVLAQHGARTKVQVAILAGYSHTSGGFRNSLSALRTAEFIDGREAITITTHGRAELGEVEPLPQGRALLEYWMANAGGKCERMILGELAAVHPRALPKEAVANRTGYQVSSGGFRNALSRLRTLQLIKGSRELVIAETLARAS